MLCLRTLLATTETLRAPLSEVDAAVEKLQAAIGTGEGGA
jgi:hypothetical protein